MSEAIWIAMVGAIALVGGHLINQVFSYRLRRKEFRVSQIQRWIDTLEAADFKAPELSQKRAGEENASYVVRVIGEFSHEATLQIWSLYQRHKYITTPERRSEFETVLEDAKLKAGQKVIKDIEAGMSGSSQVEDIPRGFSGAAMLTAYENLRAGSIGDLYEKLRKEIGGL